MKVVDVFVIYQCLIIETQTSGAGNANIRSHYLMFCSVLTTECKYVQIMCKIFTISPMMVQNGP